MPRLPRVNIDGALYYVTAKAGQSRTLFNDRQDYAMYIDLLNNYKKQFSFKLYAFVLMPAHVHLLIEIKHDSSISDIMHHLNSRYTKLYNSRYRKDGHLFSERFKSTIAEKKPNLLRLTKHIHLNPKKAATGEDPAGYPYSSCGLYLGSAPQGLPMPDMAEEIKEVCDQLNVVVPRMTYRDYMADMGGSRVDDPFDEGVSKKRIIGSDSFRKTVERAFDAVVVERKRQELIPRRLFALTSVFFILSVGVGLVYYHLYASNAMTEQRLQIVSRELTDRVNMLKNLRANTIKEFIEMPGTAEPSRSARSKELSGSTWEVVMEPTSRASQAQGPVSDRLSFSGRKFSSAYFESRGIASSNYSVTNQPNGAIVWETMQTAPDGTTVTWYGQLQGKMMKGILSLKPSGEQGRSYSFISTQGGDFNEKI